MESAYSASSSNVNFNIDNEMGTTTKPARLLSMDRFETWKENFENWVQAHHITSWLAMTGEGGYIWPIGDRGAELTVDKFTPEDTVKYVAEKKMISLIQQSVKEDILIMLPPYKTSHELWNSLCAKYYGSEEMIKTKKDLIKKEFDLFTMMKGRSLKAMLDRYCHLMVQMRSKSTNFVMHCQEESGQHTSPF